MGLPCDQHCPLPARDGGGCAADAKTLAQARGGSRNVTRLATVGGTIDVPIDAPINATGRFLLWHTIKRTGAQRC